MSHGYAAQSVHLKLPATSANLGPGFDALGLAMSFYLTIDAVPSCDGSFAIAAVGRNADLCGSLRDNLILDTYCDVLMGAGRQPLPLHLTLQNEIPLGMGCGSSAAALLAGVLLANHFGGLGWTGYQAMEEACRLEGHPDNVAACWLGGMTASAMSTNGERTVVHAASCGENMECGLLLAMPSVGLATKKARALLPESYSRADAVANIQNTALLVAAFALGRRDLLRTAMADRVHQPYRSGACPMLPLLLPVADETGVLGVALSGAGPSVLIVTEPDLDASEKLTLMEIITSCVAGVEVISTIPSKGTSVLVT
jgi:homoserine kinase